MSSLVDLIELSGAGTFVVDDDENEEMDEEALRAHGWTDAM